MLKSHLNDPHNYIVFEPNENLQLLPGITSLSLKPERYSRRMYQCTLCDPTPDYRKYQIVSNFPREEWGAIYKLLEN